MGATTTTERFTNTPLELQIPLQPTTWRLNKGHLLHDSQHPSKVNLAMVPPHSLNDLDAKPR